MAKRKQGKEEAKEKKLTVGLQKLYRFPREKRTAKAIGLLKKFVFKHTRVPEKEVLLSNKVNEAIWARGREHVPRKLDIKVIKAEGKANVFLQDENVTVPRKEKKGEKKEEKKTAEDKREEEERERKKEEKKTAEKAADAAAIKRGTL